MALERLGYGLLPEEEELGNTKILNDLLTDLNIDLKTEILAPVEFALFDAIIEQLNDLAFTSSKYKFKSTSKLLKTLSYKMKAFMYSYKRQSRTETYSTLAEARKEKSARTWSQKLLGMGKEKE
jgi:hypothetical protein